MSIDTRVVAAALLLDRRLFEVVTHLTLGLLSPVSRQNSSLLRSLLRCVIVRVIRQVLFFFLFLMNLTVFREELLCLAVVVYTAAARDQLLTTLSFSLFHLFPGGHHVLLALIHLVNLLQQVVVQHPV